MTIFGHTARHERQHARAGLTRSGQGHVRLKKGPLCPLLDRFRKSRITIGTEWSVPFFKISPFRNFAA